MDCGSTDYVINSHLNLECRKDLILSCHNFAAYKIYSIHVIASIRIVVA